MRQQDSEEFLQHLLEQLRKEAKKQERSEAFEAVNIVQFGMEQRLQCSECKRVGYRVDAVDLASLPVQAIEKGVGEEGKKLWQDVNLEDCLDSLCAVEELADYACASCGRKVCAEKWVAALCYQSEANQTRSTKFKTFPDLLVLHMKKFQLVNWMPTKLGACLCN